MAPALRGRLVGRVGDRGERQRTAAREEPAHAAGGDLSLAALPAHGADSASATASSVDPLLSPVLVLVLCVIAGVGTVLMLPARRDATFRKIGAAVLIATGLILVAMLIHSAASAPGGGHMSVYF